MKKGYPPKARLAKGGRLQVVVYSFIFFILVSIAHCSVYPALAEESTSSGDKPQKSDDGEGIKGKLEELKREIASKAAKLKEEMDRKLKDKAYVGKVKSFSETSITLAALSGPKMVSLNQDTIFEDKKSTSKSSKNKKVFSVKELAEDDYIAALGDTDETGVLIARKVILLPAKDHQPKLSLWGQIISAGEKLITLRDKDFKNIAVSLLSEAKVKLNDFVIMTGNIDKNEIFEANFIYVIRQGGILKPRKIATPSASVATSSAKPASKSASPKRTTR